MKKLIALLISIVSLSLLFSGCGSEHAQIEFIESEKINEDTHKALDAEYNNITLDKGLTVGDINKVNQCDYHFEQVFNVKESKEVSELVEFFPGMEYFDEDKNSGDNIVKKCEDVANSGFNTLMYYNYTKNKYAVISDAGNITLISSKGSDERKFKAIQEYISVGNNNEIEDNNVLKATNSFVSKVFDITGGTPPIPVALCSGQNSYGEKIYKVYLEQKIMDTTIDSFGTEYASSGHSFSSDVPNNPYAPMESTVILDKDLNVLEFRYAGNTPYSEKKELSQLPSLSSVLKYIDEEIAPNIKLTVTDLKLKYCIGTGTSDLIPVWTIWCCKDNEEPTRCTRFYVDCRSGRIDYIIDGTYGVKNIKSDK